MQISVTNPIHQTILFGAVLGIIFLLSFWKKKNYTPLSLTQELKGFAILSILFAHIGYALSNSPQFLFPFSVLAGTGVNLFLFLSGYGLTYSASQRQEGRLAFYKKRLPRLFIPFWVVLSVLFLLDYFITEGSYSLTYIAQSMLGIFTNADMYHDINSPLWYFTLILMYYLLFPLVFFKRHSWITAGVLFAAIWLLVKVKLSFFSGVIGFYEVHMLAFPLGVLAAWGVRSKHFSFTALQKVYRTYQVFLYPLALVLLSILAGYLALHGNIGKPAYIEDLTSLATMFALILLFSIKKRESKLFALFGLYSYEIYLFHWPLLYRYDLLYTHFPAWIATLVYLGIFIAIAYVVKKIVETI
jgi:peptidoglycan/LPS O-acetylase OafA/YrhL